MRFVVVDIGCIECGESSAVVGIYRSRGSALEAGREYLADDKTAAQDFRKHASASFFVGGQHHLELFEVA